MDFEDQEAVLPDEHIVATEQEKETPAEATAETKPEEQTPSPEENKEQDDDKLPFHKHPAWQRREEEWNKKLDETRAEYDKRMEDLEGRLAPREETVTTSPFLRKLVGDDPELAKDWEAEKTALAEKIRQETIETYEAQQQQRIEAVQAEEKRWTDWVDTSIKSLRGLGKQFDDNELKAIAIKYKPTDDAGNIDFNLAFELLQEKKSKETEKAEEKSTARKKFAADTNSTQKGETPKRDYMTHSDFR